MAAEGVLTASSEAAMVLQYAGVTHDTPVDPVNGQRVSYGGNEYIVMQREVDYGPGATSPDGTHLVYRMSGAEIQAEKDAAASGNPFSILQTSGISDLFSSIKDLVILGVIVYAGVALLGFLKDRKK